MGIDPNLSGPSYWETMFWSAANATDMRRKHIFKSIVLTFASPGGLTCDECNKHFDKMIRTPGYTIDEHMQSNIALVYLVWKWKSAVNNRLKKPNLPWPEVKSKYLSEDNVCETKCSAK